MVPAIWKSFETSFASRCLKKLAHNYFCVTLPSLQSGGCEIFSWKNKVQLFTAKPGVKNCLTFKKKLVWDNKPVRYGLKINENKTYKLI